jgi:hypothetical protein
MTKNTVDSIAGFKESTSNIPRVMDPMTTTIIRIIIITTSTHK